MEEKLKALEEKLDELQKLRVEVGKCENEVEDIIQEIRSNSNWSVLARAEAAGFSGIASWSSSW